MNLKKWIIPAALLMAMPLFADDTPVITTQAIDQAATAPADDQQPPTPPEQGDQPQEGAPAPEETAGKVESLTEAFTEMRNIVDAMSKMRLTGYLQAQYLNDERSVNELTSPTATRNLDQFSVRRGRVKFTYQFNPTSRFVIQPDITTSGVTL